MAQPMVTASHEGHGGVPAPFLPQLQSPLLRLPGELRNKIYEYALEDSKPPQVTGNSYQTLYKTHAARLHLFNKLKHTCRQLQAETGNMGLSRDHRSFYSSYTFASQDPDPETRLLVHYKHGVHTDRFISNIPFDRYVRLCEENPLLEVAIFTPALRKGLGCRGLLVLGAALQVILRCTELPFQVDAGISSEIESMVIHLDPRGDWPLRTDGRFLPRNIRVYPMEEFDEAEVRYSYLRKKKGFEDWVAQIREWYKHGI